MHRSKKLISDKEKIIEAYALSILKIIHNSKKPLSNRLPNHAEIDAEEQAKELNFYNKYQNKTGAPLSKWLDRIREDEIIKIWEECKGMKKSGEAMNERTGYTRTVWEHILKEHGIKKMRKKNNE